ncbi:hypothetical protein JX265_007812 [Neoarthrinium moseri]|uniref:DUF7053 domain-containing protein n=1 Tax=Neoarthrinium moseri TaxID=1658444 RepID=A0A9Q0APF2_9PEZI|nr:uncharacterized protein JN550_003392 [Neoarthrinium moseri]KAI1866511.1 hypothetical protein JX265_007812 [Neoarthrinium moseri]KAI1873139.1 hypothetical protein JN550_003392 [Neoarthrinium moseri]
MVLRKKEVYTVITPIPGFIPRQLAIDILHSHGEVITLNPLVLSHKPIKAPRAAPSDEFYSTWYEITERIQYVPGIGKLGSGVIHFNGCFHDLPWGLQTHIYAPANVDLRNKYRIGGNQPGVEPPEQQEIGLGGLGAPKDGLYLREDIEIRCNFAMVGFVKAQLKAASKEMVDRIIKKAELLDAGVLTAMIENGKIRTSNPNDRTTYTGGLGAVASPPQSPTGLYHSSHDSQPSPGTPYQIPRPMSFQVPPSMQQHQQYSRPGTSNSQQQQQTGYPFGKPNDQSNIAELPVQSAHPAAQQTIVMELPGDMYHPQSSPRLQPPQPSPALRSDQSSPGPNDWRWSQSQQSQRSQNSPGLQHSRPTSYSSESGSAPYASPGMDHKGFASELRTHQETREEHKSDSKQDVDPASRHQNTFMPYNPADYARVGR